MELTKHGVITEAARRYPNAVSPKDVTVNVCCTCLRQILPDKAELKSARINVQNISSCINQLACGGWKRNCYQIRVSEFMGLARYEWGK